MQILKNVLGVKKLSTRDVCYLGMFIALGVVMAKLSSIHITPSFKISLSFIPSFVTGVFFGPLWAGVVALLADLLTANGSPLPGLLLTSFLSGFTYGICFFNRIKMDLSYIIRLIICILIQFIINLVFNTYFLSLAGYAAASYPLAVTQRFIPEIVKMASQFLIILFAPYYLRSFSKLINNKNR